MGRTGRRRRHPLLHPLAWVLLILGPAHLWAASHLPSSFVDGPYHRVLYPRILSLLGGTCDGLEWSLSGFLLLAGILFFLFRFLGLVFSAFRPGFLLRAATALFRLLLVLSLLVHPFFLFWGYHYRGTPLERRLHLGGRPAGRSLERLAAAALAGTASLRAKGLDERSGPLPPLAGEVERGLEELGMGRLSLPRRVKAPPLPGMLLLAGTLGITSPFTLEAHAEPGLHWADLIYVKAHELSHLGGITGEGEADFCAWYSLVTSKHPLYRYCGWLGLLLRMPPSTWEARIPRDAAGDVREIRARRNRGRVEWISRFCWTVYDRFLKSRGIRAGASDYARVVRLAARFSEGHPGILK